MAPCAFAVAGRMEAFCLNVVVGVAVGWINSVQTVNVGYSGNHYGGPECRPEYWPQSYSDTVVNRRKNSGRLFCWPGCRLCHLSECFPFAVSSNTCNSVR